MEIITFDEFYAEIENTFRNYADTNDIDKVSVKTWTINELRRFGKNICDKREEIVTVKNSRTLLPENFKSLILALKLYPYQEIGVEPERERTLLIERERIENPAEWTTTTMDYFVNYCESKVVNEKIYAYGEKKDKFYTPNFLSLTKGVQSSSIDAQCLNLHPSIRDSYPDKISITNRTLNTNFREGKIYVLYNSLPTSDDGEIVIPIISTGDLRTHIENTIKIKIAEDLVINQKASPGLTNLLELWLQNQRLYYISAKSESSWSGIDQEKWSKETYSANRKRQDRYNLPR
jgi:hypothetical protein